MSVPGNRGSDDRILIVAGISIAVVLVAVGGWFFLNRPRSNQVTSAGPAQFASVRFLGMTERNGIAHIRIKENGREVELTLPVGNPIVSEVRAAKPGAIILVPSKSDSLSDPAPGSPAARAKEKQKPASGERDQVGR
jgi:hypothetical protein